jgi:hypothetical protein
MMARGRGVEEVQAPRTHVDLRNEPALYGPGPAPPARRERAVLRRNTFSGCLDGAVRGFRD